MYYNMPFQDGVPEITLILLHRENSQGRDRDLVSASASWSPAET